MVKHWAHKQTPRTVLRIGKHASSKDAKSAYYKLCQEFHPDLASHLDDEARKKRNAQFLLVQEAYEYIKSHPSALVRDGAPGASHFSSDRTRHEQTNNKSSPEFRKSMQMLFMGET
ncbi:hypothetical protein HDU91_000699 [Kappamyces sp. JEL0680]|nr:hypothetical protein HDU91_000699 [Kappamyces sp. JEL0680]